MKFFGRIVASIVIGWVLGAAVGIAISTVVYDGNAGQLPIMTVPVGIVVTYLTSFLLVQRGRGA
jgi:hypothetical protein